MLSKSLLSRLPAVVFRVGVVVCAASLSWVHAQAHAQPQPRLQLIEITDASHPYTSWDCARQPIKTRILGEMLEVKLGDESRVLVQARSASGARYVAPGDAGTEFWGKGGVANVTWSGSALPACTEAGAVVTPFRASGNEPFWAVEYDGWQLSLQQPGVAAQDFKAQITDKRSDGLTLQGENNGTTLRMDIKGEICQDTMSGQMRPYAVTLHQQGRSLQGCGGDPARLLQGVRWVLKSAGGKPLAVPAWVEFLPEGRLAGHTGCNRLMGEYTMSGEGLTLSKLGTTRMACPPAAMQQEVTLNRYLSSVRGFALDGEAGLTLRTDKGEVLAVAEAYR